jgi:hypothetical protein
MSAETYIFLDNFKPKFDVLVVLNKTLIALERNHLNVNGTLKFCGDRW